MILGYNWLVKYNLEVNWNTETIWFTRYLTECRMQYQDILFTSMIWRLQLTEDTNKEQQEIGKKLNLTNSKDLLKYIQLFIYLFNKKKFGKLSEWKEWDHTINLIEDTPKELNAKAYAIIVKEDEVLNQWLEEQLKTELIVESSLWYVAPCFDIPKKNRSLRLV